MTRVHVDVHVHVHVLVCVQYTWYIVCVHQYVSDVYMYVYSQSSVYLHMMIIQTSIPQAATPFSFISNSEPSVLEH